MRVVVGDPHTEQMIGALLPSAEAAGWGVVALLKGGSSLESPAATGEAEWECRIWREAAVAQALAYKPAALFTVITAGAGDSPNERLIASAQQLVDEVNAQGDRVYGIRDNPRSATNLYDCAWERRDCDWRVEHALKPSNPAGDLTCDIGLIDFTPWICPDEVCRTEIGDLP